MAATRASDQAYLRLRDAIVDLRYPPGALINEQLLADELELGRMPVREALARLAKDRFVTVLPRRGSLVTSFTFTEIAALFQAREVVECGIAHIAAATATDAQLDELRALSRDVDTARGASDLDTFLRTDHAFHAHLAQMIANPLLHETAELLLLNSLRFWRQFWAGRAVNATEMLSHGELIAALRSRDPDTAEAAMRTHLRAARAFVSTQF